MARSLAVNNIQRLLGIPNPEALPADQELPPGHMRLFDNWRPSLPAGTYSIEATQTISGRAAGQTFPDQKIENAPASTSKTAPGQQLFNVVAPQFSLDPSFINSYYPPDGHQDEGKILPHVVFGDPHVPWLRPAGKTNWMTGDRKNLPWLALMVFKAEDLRVSPEEALQLNLTSVISGKTTPSDGSTTVETKVYDPANLPVTGAFGMTVKDYLMTFTSRVKYENSANFESLKKSSEKTSIIFPRKNQLQSVFNPTNDDQLKGLDSQKLLSHVRQLNTEGFPDMGVSGHGFYSVVVSSMTGDLMVTAPTTLIVHLVSIEHLDGTLSRTADSSRIGIVSLFSWTYHCIPEAVNFEEMMKNLGIQSQPLRPPKEQMDILSKRTQDGTTASKAAAKLYDRLNAGYTIARWRAPSGEEGSAFNRGPLVPLSVPEVPGDNADWPAISMTGRDYSVFDKSIGMLDATYANAWSLGKLLAISDPAFNSALFRFRSSIWNTSASQLRMKSNGIQDWTDSLTNAVNGLSVGEGLSEGNFKGPVSRIKKPADVPLAPTVDDPSMAEDLSNTIQSSVTSAASVPGSDGGLYNGFLLQSASSSDWEIIYNWIYDVLFLGHIPAHVLFPEPSHLKGSITTPVIPGQTKLQPEALRFFYIDHGWIDCFLDGALSCANHVEPQYDNIRLKVKQIFNDVLSTAITSGAPRPPVPRYGFVLRSAAVKSTPDIKLKVRCWSSKPDIQHPGKYIWTTNDDRDPLLRHTKLDDSTILSLVDCLPEEISYIEFAQPAHQQRFSFGVNVTIDASTGLPSAVKPNVDVIKLFTDSRKAPPFTEAGDGTRLSPPDLEWTALPTQLNSDAQVGFYRQASRCIDAIAICGTITTNIVDWGKTTGCFIESTGGDAQDRTRSSIFGLEMNDRAYHFKITSSPPKAETGPLPTWTRKLWTGRSQNSRTRSARMLTTALPVQSKFLDVVLAQPSTIPSSFPSPIKLNQTRSVPMLTSPITPAAAGQRTTRIPIQPFPYSPSIIPGPEFELLVHPDYRPPPPRPDTLIPGTWTFSVQDVLPTQTKYLYDLILSIRRRNSGNVHRTLKYLHIEIPISRGSLAKDQEDLDGFGLGHRPREPLLASGLDTHGGVRVVANQRFVVSMFNGPASTINDGRWDGMEVLLITLTPRSGTEDGTMALLGNHKSDAVTVRLGEVVLSSIVTPETISVYKKVKKDLLHPFGIDKDRVPERAKVPIRLTEVYGNDFPMASSWCMAVKADMGDESFDGSQ